jgi:hypothetical protein
MQNIGCNADGARNSTPRKIQINERRRVLGVSAIINFFSLLFFPKKN